MTPNRDLQRIETDPALDVVFAPTTIRCCWTSCSTRSHSSATQEVGGAVTVVDNNSPAATAEVVARHERQGKNPGLRRIVEPQQGLTLARLLGIQCTSASWIAFVDDDCVLDAEWIQRASEFRRRLLGLRRFRGTRGPDYQGNTPAIVRRRYGWAFAEQDLGAAPVTVDCLRATAASQPRSNAGCARAA